MNTNVIEIISRFWKHLSRTDKRRSVGSEGPYGSPRALLFELDAVEDAFSAVHMNPRELRTKTFVYDKRSFVVMPDIIGIDMERRDFSYITRHFATS